jgi:hypothetical protein
MRQKTKAENLHLYREKQGRGLLRFMQADVMG